MALSLAVRHSPPCCPSLCVIHLLLDCLPFYSVAWADGRVAHVTVVVCWRWVSGQSPLVTGWKGQRSELDSVMGVMGGWDEAAGWAEGWTDGAVDGGGADAGRHGSWLDLNGVVAGSEMLDRAVSCCSRGRVVVAMGCCSSVGHGARGDGGREEDGSGSCWVNGWWVARRRDAGWRRRSGSGKGGFLPFFTGGGGLSSARMDGGSCGRTVAAALAVDGDGRRRGRRVDVGLSALQLGSSAVEVGEDDDGAPYWCSMLRRGTVNGVPVDVDFIF
ncbi:hypothetical protein ACLOJK_017869 [Asimina triloba]